MGRLGVALSRTGVAGRVANCSHAPVWTPTPAHNSSSILQISGASKQKLDKLSRRQTEATVKAEQESCQPHMLAKEGGQRLLTSVLPEH